jgi:hypothetical protein
MEFGFNFMKLKIVNSDIKKLEFRLEMIQKRNSTEI